MTALILIASALTSVVYVPSVAQMYVWRLAPIVVLLAQIYSARMIAGEVAAEAGSTKGPAGAGRAAGRWLLPPVWRALFVIVAGECFVYYYYLRHRDRLVLEVLGGILLLGVAACAVRRLQARAPFAPRLGTVRRSRRPISVVAALAGAALLFVAFQGFTGHSNLPVAATPESQLYSWARTATDPAAVFLIPPDLDGFRLASQRAVVVDWKSTPFAPRELEEWYRRIDAVSGGTRPRTEAQAAAGYTALGSSSLAGLADVYAASYAVARDPAGAPPACRVVFDNGRYEVLKTGIATRPAGS
jgi:hypothetical protein